MEITARNEKDVVVASLNGRMDAVSAPQFDAWLSERLQASQNKIVLDMSGLEYISSAGLRSLLAAAKQLKAVGGTVVLSSISGTVEEVFRMSGFLAIFKVSPSTSEAVGTFA